MEMEFNEAGQAALIVKLTEEERFCLDAYMITQNKGLAYRLSRKRETGAGRVAFNTLVYKFFKEPKVKAYLQKRQNDLINGKLFNFDKNNELAGSNDNMAESVNFMLKDDNLKVNFINSFQRMYENTRDVKLKSELGMKLATLRGWNKGEQELIEDNKVVFYLPLKCSKCPKNK